MKDDELTTLARVLGEILAARGMSLALAESCTGGGVGEAVTRIPGSSAWFDRGFVTYSNEAKSEMLGVEPEIIDAHGAVSEETAQAMALGALEHSGANVAASVTGVAGPDGGTAEKPVGLVWFAWALRDGTVRARSQRFPGDRDAVRRASVAYALQGLIDLLRS